MMSREPSSIGIVWKIVSIPTFVIAMMSCASTKTTFSSTAYVTNRIAIDRLLIIANVEGVMFSHNMYRGLRTGLASRLEACGVKSRILHVDPLDLDDRVDYAANAFQAVATMAIIATGSKIVEAAAIGHAQQRSFELAIFDVKSGDVVWRAVSVLDLGTPSVLSDDVRSGKQFATAIISQLRDDGVLKGCAEDMGPWPDIEPDCQKERKQVLMDAAQIKEPDEQVKMIRSAPVCD